MRFSYPKSFLTLLLIGFVLAMLPLFFAFGNAALYLDRLSEQIGSTVAEAVQATRASRVLVEQLTLMERSTRQYFVLQDKELMNNFGYAHAKFNDAVHALASLPLTKNQTQALTALAESEQALSQQIITLPGNPKARQQIVTQFLVLSDQAKSILEDNNRAIDRASAFLTATAERTKKIMLWQTLTLIPVALLVTLVIAFLVAQPMRHMDAAIRHLGAGDYKQPISIDGPGDLRSLGERLEWLRGQLDDLEQQKQRFLRHVSHELKTPLTAIRQGCELLADEVGGALTSQQREISDILRENSLRLQKMIENLLNFTAVQFQKPVLKLEKIAPEGLVEQIIHHYALTLASKQIEIQRHFASLNLWVDQEKLHTVLDNLLSNAIKYTPQNGHIRIGIVKDRQFALFEVHDSGPGVMTIDQTRLFEPFYRGGGHYDSLVSGTGLGLSIAREYVLAHGGEIALQPSEYGAHFTVRLPLEPISA